MAEDTMFFPRLRRQAKWMFVFLALVFGVGFVVFGVGSNAPSGLGDVLNLGSGSGAPSVSDAREKLEKNPNNAAAMRELATALQTDNRSDEAIPVLERYVQLRPREEGAMQELAALYAARASRLRNEAELAQYEAQSQLAGATFGPPPTGKVGQALGTNPVAQAISEKANARLNDAYTRMQSAYRDAQRAYERVVARSPSDASLQLQLADTAVYAGDTQAAVAAYKRFLKLAPDDPLAESVRQELRRLQSPAAGAAPG